MIRYSLAAQERRSRNRLFAEMEKAAKGESVARIVSVTNGVQVRDGSAVVASCACNDNSARSIAEAERHVIAAARRQGYQVVDEMGEVI